MQHVVLLLLAQLGVPSHGPIPYSQPLLPDSLLYSLRAFFISRWKRLSACRRAIAALAARRPASTSLCQ